MTYAAIAATARLLRRVDNWWLHVDLDVLSTDALPAVDYPQPGGLRWSELEAAHRGRPACAGLPGNDLVYLQPRPRPGRQDAHRIVDYLGQLGARELDKG